MAESVLHIHIYMMVFLMNFYDIIDIQLYMMALMSFYNIMVLRERERDCMHALLVIFYYVDAM